MILSMIFEYGNIRYRLDGWTNELLCWLLLFRGMANELTIV